jgi:hypothetical protein
LRLNLPSSQPVLSPSFQAGERPRFPREISIGKMRRKGQQAAVELQIQAAVEFMIFFCPKHV